MVDASGGRRQLMLKPWLSAGDSQHSTQQLDAGAGSLQQDAEIRWGFSLLTAEPHGSSFIVKC